MDSNSICDMFCKNLLFNAPKPLFLKKEVWYTQIILRLRIDIIDVYIIQQGFIQSSIKRLKDQRTQ